MIALLIISALLLGTGGYALFRRQHHEPPDDHELAPPAYSGLFNEDTEIDFEAEAQSAATRLRESLLQRAATSDLTVLEEAYRLGDHVLYNDVLDAALKASAACQEGTGPLVSCIVQSKELRANRNLAEAVLEKWKASPESISGPDVLHIAALSDDASVFQTAIETFLSRLTAVLPSLSPKKLRDLIESEYWVLSSEARRSPAGFVLKERIALARSELQKAPSRVTG